VVGGDVVVKVVTPERQVVGGDVVVKVVTPERQVVSDIRFVLEYTIS
jgi:F0F1-type ATP synthase epsilon subunit